MKTTIMQNGRDDYSCVIKHKDPEDHKFIRMKRVTIQTLEKEDEEEEEEKRRCSNDVSVTSQYM